MNENMLLDAIGEARPDLVEAAHAVRKRNRVWPRIAAAAACICLCLLGAVPALAAADVRPAYELLYAVAPSAAQRLKPVSLACEDNGIVMEVVSALVEGDTAELLVSIRDTTGSRIDRTADLFDSYSINTPAGTVGTCRKTDFDGETGSVFFLIELSTMNGEPISGDKITFSVREILYAKSLYDCPIKLPEEPSELRPASEARGLIRGGSGDLEAGKEGMLVVPGETETPLTRGVSLTGWAEWDGKLSVQIRYEDILETDNHGDVYLLAADGGIIPCLYTVAVHDGADSLEDYVFDATEAREGSLRGSFTTGGGLVKGDWQVTVPLE
ncbi:MAG: hypothetical protein K6F67_08295 [Oscillospiraceae bacterium]|nr:hypothetical protein [Oscillospiraceae bacterium]